MRRKHRKAKSALGEKGNKTRTKGCNTDHSRFLHSRKINKQTRKPHTEFTIKKKQKLSTNDFESRSKATCLTLIKNKNCLSMIAKIHNSHESRTNYEQCKIKGNGKEYSCV